MSRDPFPIGPRIDQIPYGKDPAALIGHITDHQAQDGIAPLLCPVIFDHINGIGRIELAGEDPVVVDRLLVRYIEVCSDRYIVDIMKQQTTV